MKAFASMAVRTPDNGFFVVCVFCVEDPSFVLTVVCHDPLQREVGVSTAIKSTVFVFEREAVRQTSEPSP
jgi:hypothetical protein